MPEHGVGTALERLREELTRVAPSGSWKLVLYRVTVLGAVHQPLSIACAAVGGDADPMDQVVALAAYQTHSTIVGDLTWSPDLINAAVFTGDTHYQSGTAAVVGFAPATQTGAVIAVPTFDPHIYDPSPVLRPVVGVLAARTMLSAKVIVENRSIRYTVERYAESLAGLVKEPHSHYPPHVVESLTLNPELQSIFTTDSDGTPWKMFRPGYIASEPSLSEFARVTKLQNESRIYLDKLREVKGTIS